MESVVAYVFVRKQRDRVDSPEFIIQDDADELREALGYLNDLSESSSQVVNGEVHGADPGQKWHVVGDWYLIKKHELDISHGLAESILSDE